MEKCETGDLQVIFSLESLKHELPIWPGVPFASCLRVCDLLDHHLFNKNKLTS